MYTTPDEVMAATPYTDVTIAEVQQAQFVIEVYTGRVESEIDGARDKSMLARAVIAQTVYMRDNSDVTFEQIAASSINRGGEMTTFGSDGVSPFIAPLAVMACKHLSWRKTHSVKIGKTVGREDRARILYWMALFGSLSGVGLDGYGLDGNSPGEYGVVPFNVDVWDDV
jgi:hypothetical protein